MSEKVKQGRNSLQTSCFNFDLLYLLVVHSHSSPVQWGIIADTSGALTFNFEVVYII